MRILRRQSIVRGSIHIAVLLALAFAALGTTPLTADEPKAPFKDHGALGKYVAKEDPSYGWTVRQEATLPGGVKVTELTLTSQTWRDIVWKHRLLLFKPEEVTSSQTLMMIAGGSWHERDGQPPEKPGADLPQEALILAGAVKKLGAPVALLLNVPQQPVFGGMVEDEIISYTFEEFLKSGDDEWPLLLPMTKSAVRAMDAIQEYAKQEWDVEVDGFTVTGGSKRGWTTWLAGAVDPRATAIAPMVIDVLNMPLQMNHQLEAWGEFSEQIADYTRRGIQLQADSEIGRRLNGIVDPYSYRAVLTQPKLIVIGTNDRYWPLDALNIYWDDLQGEKYILYVPNNGHGVNDLPRLVGTVSALQRRAAGQLELPQLSWKLEPSADALRLEVDSDQEPKSVVAWTATSPTRDFREVKWTSTPTELVDGVYRYDLEIPSSGYAAMFGEAVYEAEGVPYFLSTNVKIVGGTESTAAAGGSGK